jgi:hypothetical protein
MEPAIENILESLPSKPPRSKLEPHREFIRELRRRGRTYREVARIFQERLGLSVAPSTLHYFIKVRARGRKLVQFELPPVDGVNTTSLASDRIAALKAKPAGQRAQSRSNTVWPVVGEFLAPLGKRRAAARKVLQSIDNGSTSTSSTEYAERSMAYRSTRSAWDNQRH